jgi:hypothetical protein
MTNWRKLLLSLFFAASLALPYFVHAQDVNDQALYGGETQKTGLAATLGLSDSDPRIVGANLIRIFLGFLGLVAVGLILYAGWVYMKSQGNEQEIEKSKNILKSATIGLLIILSAFAIVTFILSNILNATGGNGSDGDGGLPGGGWFDGEYDLYMVGSEPAASEMNVFRDQAIILSFNLQLSSEVATSSFFELSKVAEYSLTKFETEISADTASSTANSGPVAITVSTSSDMTSVIIKASSSCEAFNGVSTTTYQNCLTSWSKYHVKIKDTVASLNGKPVDCNATNHLCEFDFYTNDSFGEGRPVIRSITPVGGFCRQGSEPNSSTTNEACLTSRDCQHWVSSTSATNPDWRCDTATPNAKAGNFVTISGRNFGDTAGTIEFSKNNGSSLDWLVSSTSKSVNAACAGWTDSEIVAVMPAGVALDATSSVKITTAKNQVEYNNDKFGPRVKDVLANGIERPGLCQITPDHGAYSSTTLIYGQKLYQTWGYMGDLDAKSRATSSVDNGSIAKCGVPDGKSCAGTVPNISVGNTSAFVLQGLVYSNFIGFHKDVEAYRGPMITSLTPTAGPKGQYVTIGGSGFGYAVKNQLGFGHGSSSRIAIFVRKTALAGLSSAVNDFSNSVCRPDNAACTKDFVEASFAFPQICSDDLWKNNQVIVKVPKAIDDGTDGSVGDYYVYLFFPKDGEPGSWLIGSDQMNENNALTDIKPGAKQEYFTADKNAALLPGLCSIRPSAGLPGTLADIYGEYYPAKTSDQNLYFSTNIKVISASWLGFDSALKADRATATVPIGAITGSVNIKLSNGSTSNPIDFKVGDCKASNECGAGIFCCQSGSAFAGKCQKGTDEQNACYSSLRSSVFAWSFSTYLSTSSDSCSGFANANACMLANTCPNSPGTCQSGEQAKKADDQACTNDYCAATYSEYCAGNKCVYDSSTNHCASSSAGTVATIATCSVTDSAFILPGTNNKKVEAYCNEVEIGTSNSGVATSEFYWQYKPKFGASCEGNSAMALGGWCTIKDASDQPKICSSCSDGFKCQAGKCVIGDEICSGNSTCDATSGKCRENFTCECCCKIGNDKQDCCAGLTCTPDLCVNDAKNAGPGPANNPDNFIYGQCTGCTKFASDGVTIDQEASNLACSCNGGNRYCNTAPQVYINGAWKQNPNGICQDRAKLDEPCSGSNPSIFETSVTDVFNNQLGNDPQYAYWRLDEASTSKDLSDSIRLAKASLGIATQVNGLSSLAQRTEDGCMSGNCLRFSSSSANYANLGSVGGLVQGDQTWSFWYKPTSASAANIQTIAFSTNFLGAYYYNEKIRLVVCLDKNAAGLCGSTKQYLLSGKLPLDQWSHVVVVVQNGKKVELVVNNVSTSTDFAGKHIGTSTAADNLYLGKTTIFAAQPVNGYIDEVQFYTKALDSSTVTKQTNVFGLVLPATYNSSVTTVTTHKIGQSIAAGASAAYWQSDTQIPGKSYLDYNGKYTIGTKPGVCTTTDISLSILPGATTTCRLVNNLKDGTLDAGYWQVKKPQNAPCPAKTILAPASSQAGYSTYPWCTVISKVNTCAAYNATTSLVNGLDLAGGEARCNVFTYGASSTNQAAYCSANLPICQTGLQCDPNSCTCQVESTSTETSTVRAGEPCVKDGGTCTVGVPSCDAALTNLECREDGSNADCRCCCNPGDGSGKPKTATYPNGADTKNVFDSKGQPSQLICLPNKEPCSGGQRGLFCGCVDDNQCNNGADGCGIDTCCNSRPFAVGTYPYGYAGEVGLTNNNNMKPVCRNTQISMTFNGSMDAASFTGNVIVAGDYGTDLCPSGTTYLTTIAKPSRFAWFNRLFAKVVTLFVGNDSAFAQANKTLCAVEGRVTAEDSGKRIVFSPLKILDYNRVYHVVVVGDANKTNALREGVLNVNGIGLHDDDGTGTRHTLGGPNSFAFASSSLNVNGRDIFGYTWHFKTKDQADENQGICLVNSVVVNTKASSTAWVFTTSVNNPIDDASGAGFDQVATDSDKDFVAKALTKDNQPIVSIAGLYSWNYAWSSQNTALIGIRNHPDNLNDHNVAYVVKNQKDAQTTVTAEATINDDTINTPTTKDKKFSGKAAVRIFMCNNPWPPLNDPSAWPWKDSSTNCSNKKCLGGTKSGMACTQNTDCPGGTCPSCDSNNFEFYYCRDAGGPGTADDLPVISSNPVGIGRGQGYCDAGYSYNQTCSDNSGCLEPEKGTLKCVNKVCTGGAKLDNSAWPNAGGKCQSDYECQSGGNCKVLLKEFFFGRDSVVGGASSVITANSSPFGAVANLSWAKVAGATKYKVYYGLQAGKYTNNEAIPGTNCNTTTCTAAIGNLANDKTYYFAFTSLNDSNAESVYSSEANVLIKDVTAPAKPVGVAATNVTAGSADIAWTANSTDQDLSAYRVYVGHASGNYGEYYTINKPNAKYTVTELTSGKTYYFKVTAVDKSGNESAFDEFSFQTLNQ